jgi:hypothetical protein
MQMKLSVTRLDDRGRYETMIVRDDGVRFRLKGHDRTFALPHDIAHLVVEKALGLQGGIWGRIAAGAVFPSMSHVDGRRKPKAAERSKVLLKANPDQLSEAEVLVRIFCETIREGHNESSRVLSQRLKERRIPPGGTAQIAQAQISNVFMSYRDLLARWSHLPVGSAIELDW